MILLILIVISALGVSGLCSILEASLLSASLVKLSKRKGRGDKGAARLLELKEKHIDDSISAILTYNTIAHTVGAALSGAQAARVFGDQWVGLFSGVLTLMILVFTEIIPKTVGTVYAERLAGFSGRVISLMILPPMKWLLYLTRALTRLFAKKSEKMTTRGDVQAIVRLATRDGALADGESEVMSNLLRLKDIQVCDVMTPRTVVSMFEETLSIREALTMPEVLAYSRVPVYRERRDNFQGYILIRELLNMARDPENVERSLSELARPILVIEETLSVEQALKDMQRQAEHFAIVIDELGVLSGVVSLEDLFETMLGQEIVDEFDKVADLRRLALELRDKRLARMKRRWQPIEADQRADRERTAPSKVPQ